MGQVPLKPQPWRRALGDTGSWGEDAAADYLVGEGYAINARNYRVGRLEVDIIATRADVVAFVEVKTRPWGVSGRTVASEVLPPRKIANIAAAADAYMRRLRLPLRPRLDLVIVTGTPAAPQIDHIADAMRPPLRTYR